MRRLLLLFVVLAAVFAPAASADAPQHANGGGRGTIDWPTPFSQFGFHVSKTADGSVRGHFNCLMAGSSRFEPFTLMAVRGQATSLSVSGDTATFEGSGMLQTGNLGKEATTFRVVVTDGGPGEGTLQLTAFTTSLGVVELPIEFVLNGQIAVG